MNESYFINSFLRVIWRLQTCGFRRRQVRSPVSLMLYAGIRPNEVARLSWNDIDLAEKAIYILPRHGKTGGARRVTIHPPLLKILQKHYISLDNILIWPPNWIKHWRSPRRSAGWEGNTPWRQDALRHTFASYHLQYFRSYAELQLEIGRRDANLLRTSYLDMRGVKNADSFWKSS